MSTGSTDVLTRLSDSVNENSLTVHSFILIEKSFTFHWIHSSSMRNHSLIIHLSMRNHSLVIRLGEGAVCISEEPGWEFDVGMLVGDRGGAQREPSFQSSTVFECEDVWCPIGSMAVKLVLGWQIESDDAPDRDSRQVGFSPRR